MSEEVIWDVTTFYKNYRHNSRNPSYMLDVDIYHDLKSALAAAKELLMKLCSGRYFEKVKRNGHYIEVFFRKPKTRLSIRIHVCRMTPKGYEYADIK